MPKYRVRIEVQPLIWEDEFWAETEGDAWDWCHTLMERAQAAQRLVKFDITEVADEPSE